MTIAEVPLEDLGTKEEVLTEDHYPASFYQTRIGLSVWDDFLRSRIAKKAKPTKKGAKFNLKAARLKQDLRDEQVEAALGADHHFDETVVCAVVAALIAKQPNGEDGRLLNNRCANLFYTSSFVMFVFWSSLGRYWQVRACRRGVNSWRAGRQVFSPAT